MPAPTAASDLFRRSHELSAAFAWSISFVYVVALVVVFRLGFPAALLLCVISFGMALLRWHQTVQLWRRKLGLIGTAVRLLPSAALRGAREKVGNALWLGWGWRWGPKHTQMTYEIGKRNLTEVYPPPWALKALGVNRDPSSERGLQWVHGLDHESDFIVPFDSLEGHTGILAVTGALKTSLYRLMVYQFAQAGDTVIILDPKGDKDLRRAGQLVCEELNQPDRFLSFHPAFPSSSVRIDGLRNWDRETQAASRIRALIKQSEDDAFVNFAWKVCYQIIACRARLGRRTTIAELLTCVEMPTALEDLGIEVLERYLSEVMPGLGKALRESSEDGEGRPNQRSAVANPHLVKLIKAYKEVTVKTAAAPQVVTGLVASLEQNREWMGKMANTLIPDLTKLASGDLKDLLSPDPTNLDDERPIFDMGKVIEGNKVMYIGLDALSDSTVASAIAALLLADIQGYAGERYNYTDNLRGAGRKRIHVLIDEWGDVICEPVIQIANKARGAGILLYLAGQTFADVVTKFGDVHMAKRLIGNLNNLIVGATSDRDTLDIIRAKLGEVTIEATRRSGGTGQKTEDAGLEFSANRSVAATDITTDMIPDRVIMGLPNLQGIAIVNRSDVVKFAIPALILEEKNG